MAKNAGESRIPLPRTVRPSLLPKIRSLGPPSKISSAGHRRSPVGYNCAPQTTGIPGLGGAGGNGGGCGGFNNKQQQCQQFGFGKSQSGNLLVETSNKQAKSRRSTPDTEKDCLLDTDYSISAIWNATADNKEADHLMRLNEEKLSLLRSQEDLASFGCVKKKPAGAQRQASREDVVEGGFLVGGVGCVECAIESPVATAPHYLMLTKQNSFEHDESSLGILTPDQMTDFTVALESSRTPSCENLDGQHAGTGKFLLGKSAGAVVAAAARHLDIAACAPSIGTLAPQSDRSPSLEELPLDPIVIIDEDVDLLEDTLCTGEATPSIHEQPADTSSEPSSKTSTTTAPDSTETSEHTSEQQQLTRVSNSGVGGGGGIGIGIGIGGGAHVLPTSFITSVTSITSLEAGYQGDGENSRPASRGPEPLSINAPVASLLVSAACRQDPMTDSDFFTESDADAHEDAAILGGGGGGGGGGVGSNGGPRGDRRAQVIDGTLFCAAPGDRRCPGFEPPAEEMDSSGIYSDLDKRQDSVGPDAEAAYGDGDHTTDTGDTEISMRSQPSPQDKPAPAMVTKNMLTPQDMLNDTMELNSTSSTAEVTVIKCQKNEQNTATKSKSNISNKENSAPLKKYKMPKRNVISKIKTMIESNQNIVVKEETESEPRRPQRQQRKNGRWDAVMTKIEAGKQRGRSLKKEVKSRVLQGLGTSTSSTASTSSTRRPAGDANNNANKDKRRARGRPEMNSPNQETARSSVRSSASDLSSAHSKEAPKRPTRKNCIDAHQPNNNQLNSNINKSNLTTVRKAPSIKSVQSNVSTKQKNATTNKVADRNCANSAGNRPTAAPPPVAITTTTTTSSSKDLHGSSNGGPVLNNNHHSRNHHHHHHHLHNNNHNNINSHRAGTVSETTTAASTPTPEASLQKLLLVVDTREQEIQTELGERQKEEEEEAKEAWSKRAEDTVQALAITVQYFTHQLEELSDGRARKDLDKMKTEWLTARTELEELRLREARVEDALNREREEHRQAIESLREDLERELAERSSLEDAYQETRRRHEDLSSSLRERECEHRLALERLTLELERAQSRARTTSSSQSTTQDASLLAEVESLRTVLEIRSQENGQLRSEVDLLRRELDDKEALKQRCESLEARCEDLRAQLQSKEEFERQLAHDNEVLRGSIHQYSKQNKRLSQKNEELFWRLRQKNEVVSVLTNQLTPQSQRLSKSLGPEQIDHPANESNCSQKSQEASCSMVKYMVEKGDSVSWTLDITESMLDSTLNSSVGGGANKTSSPSSRRTLFNHEANPSASTNGTTSGNCASASGKSFVTRQSSMRLSKPRRTTLAQSGRARSNSVSVAETSSSSASARAAAVAAAAAAASAMAVGEEAVCSWSPSYQSTPLQRRRNGAGPEQQSWSLSNTVTEATCCGAPGGNVVPSAGKVTALEMSTTDEEEDEEEEEEEEVRGQRPQEAGGEAMISEETSASSSGSEDDSSEHSSASSSSSSSSDIP